MDIAANADSNVDISFFKELRNIFHEASDIDTVIHLAAILSTNGEKQISTTHTVNATGTLNLMTLSENKTFFFPSSIAVYGYKKANDKTLENFI